MKTLLLISTVLIAVTIFGISKSYAQYGEGFSPVQHYPPTNDTKLQLIVMNSTEFTERTTGYNYAFAGIDYNWVSKGNNNYDFGGARVTFLVSGFENGTTKGEAFNLDSQMNVKSVFEYDADRPPAGYRSDTCHGCLLPNASQTDVDKFHIGHVADGTYNETAALQRSTQLMNMKNEKMTEKQNLEVQLTTKQHDYDDAIKNSNATKVSSLLGDINEIKNHTSSLQEQIDKITQELNAIQEANIQFYYMDPVLLKKYQAASDGFATKIQVQYWKGKSFDEQKNAFPLVGIGVDSKKKSVEITLWKGIENSTNVDRYISVIKELMPSDVPWHVGFDEYPTAYYSTLTMHPLQQVNSGILAKDVRCNQGFQLIFKTEDGSPACVKNTSIGRLVRQGWWAWNDKVGNTIVNTPEKKDFDSKNCALFETASSIVGTNGFGRDDLPQDGITYPGKNLTGLVGQVIQFSIKPNSEGYITFTYDFNPYPGSNCKVTTKDAIAAGNPAKPNISIPELIGSPDILKVDENSVNTNIPPLGNTGDILVNLTSAENLNDHVIKVTYKIFAKPDAQLGKSYFIGFWWHSAVVITVGDSLYTGNALAGPRYG